ncbi:hypothetical protein TTHERM_00442230 (macronuclear) [Tetrahymena thermophila SB210]|uniref:Uncharacterized protein n=1 Tax=Tetrahymena thermophila (strain SB210) TaxID=312017 RepID=I7M6M3_TETTS|nr:hypothetical protein TTHERM_00442230 [Tetrahymena thermophila SB210]EAR85473.3 hypothetical protein TTHERM_00442230 [Tetrahymena thermophila SB210]|eukprot:XP_001033136.3 hypothetical protein TTHERM_00442230 [Tetrahymena thermophila SB210]
MNTQNIPSLQSDSNQEILKDNLSKGATQKSQVKSAQNKDNNGSPNDILSAFNHKSSISKLNQDLINSSFNQTTNTLGQQLADILFYCRKRLDENSVDYLTKVIPLDYEKEEMELIEVPELAQYIKQIINYLTKCKLEMEAKMQQLIKPDEEYMNEYEGMLQKMEAECRNHIRIEQQLKIYAETAQERLEFVERDLEVLEKQNEELKLQLNKMTQTNEELIGLNRQRDDKIDQLKKKIKELEEQVDKQQQQLLHQSSSSLNKLAKIPLHNNRGSIRDSVDHNQQINSNHYGEQSSLSGAMPSSGGNSHKNLIQNNQNQSAHPSSSENSSQKQQVNPQQLGTNQQSLQNKRSKRSVSTLNSGVNNDEGSNTQREVMKQLENNANRLKTEPYHNINHSTGQNSNALKSTSSSHQYNMNGSQNTQPSNTYSQDALAYLLGNSNYKPSSSSSQNNRSSTNIKEDNKRIMEKYLFDKGDKAVLKKIYGDSAKSKSFIDLNKSQKNQNSSRGNSTHASKGSQPSSSQNQQQNLIKQIQQQQIIKQVQSQQVLNRIQQKINQTIQNNGSSKNSNANNSSNNLSNLYHNNSSNNNTLSQSQTQRALSRSKSRSKVKESSNDNSKIQKEYNIYTLNPQNVYKVQQAKNSPLKQSKQDSHRSQSLDAYSKMNNSKQQASYNLK